MIRLRIISFAFIAMLSPLLGYSINFDLTNRLEVLETYSQKMRIDSVIVALKLDSAKSAYLENDYNSAIALADDAFELSKKFPNYDFAVQSVLILARSFRDIHLQNNDQLSFNNTLKYYLKAITTLESTESRLLLPKIYKEYGDFYAKLNLPELTIENYVKALNIVVEGQDYSLQKEIIEKIAFLSYDLGDIETSINHYNTLYVLHKNLNEETDKIKVLKTLSSLYKENKDYENAIFASKELLNYYQRIGDESNQIAYLSKIGEISYASGNLDQADKAFKSYFRLAKKDEHLQKEIASLRYIQNLITEGDIYTWS
ncbi:MAG: hypothetical protein KAQ62_23265, partial [Cyclobacteriaceae bacterium]|nr:hypothetical protein [Cyclobacteriaceae bacterium]